MSAEELDESLSPDENALVWAEEAQRRALALKSGALSSRPAADVFRDAAPSPGCSECRSALAVDFRPSLRLHGR